MNSEGSMNLSTKIVYIASATFSIIDIYYMGSWFEGNRGRNGPLGPNQLPWI